MPVIRVWGLEYVGNFALKDLSDQLKEITAGIDELGLEPSQVSVLFPSCRGIDEQAREIIVEINPIFARDGRTDEVLTRLATKLGEAVEAWWPGAHIREPALIECFSYRFDERQGFWTSAAARTKDRAGSA
jgi:hypothetical protein